MHETTSDPCTSKFSGIILVVHRAGAIWPVCCMTSATTFLPCRITNSPCLSCIFIEAPSPRQPRGWDAETSQPLEAERPRSAREQAAGVAVTGIYAGLKLTGLALRVATDVASSLSKDAERMMAQNEAQRAQQVSQRGAG